jgi:alkylation response protein AidB-like acyl-CoA dehydrogenase
MMSPKTDWIEVIRELGPGFAERTAEHDANDSFVAENYAALKERGFYAAPVPSELGGGGATLRELCAAIRELAHFCSSTALASAMHTHVATTLATAWRGGNKGPEGILRRVAAEKLVLVSTGGADWLAGSGKLEKVDGGYRLTGRKIFCSGVPSGDFLMTTGIYDDPKDGPTVFHIPVPLKAEGVTIVDTWRVLGMRGTGSNDVQLKDVLIPDAAAQGVRRPAGKWHPSIHTVCGIALPIIYSAYLGVAESARDIALGLARRKKDDPSIPYSIGEMENQLTIAQLAHASLIDISESGKPCAELTSAILSRRTIVAKASIATVEKAMEVAGGAAFYRSAQLERLFRDIQASRYHPLQEKQQLRLTGRLALGLEIDG